MPTCCHASDIVGGREREEKKEGRERNGYNFNLRVIEYSF
jgi:hypothetical protein